MRHPNTISQSWNILSNQICHVGSAWGRTVLHTLHMCTRNFDLLTIQIQRTTTPNHATADHNTLLLHGFPQLGTGLRALMTLSNKLIPLLRIGTHCGRNIVGHSWSLQSFQTCRSRSREIMTVSKEKSALESVSRCNPMSCSWQGIMSWMRAPSSCHSPQTGTAQCVQLYYAHNNIRWRLRLPCTLCKAKARVGRSGNACGTCNSLIMPQGTWADGPSAPFSCPHCP